MVAGHAISDHEHSIYDQFGGTNLEDDNAPPSNEPTEYESFEANSQRHEYKGHLHARLPLGLATGFIDFTFPVSP